MNQCELLQTGEVAKLLDLSDERVRQLEKQGKLSAQRTARGVRLFNGAEVEALRIERKDAASTVSAAC